MILETKNIAAETSIQSNVSGRQKGNFNRVERLQRQRYKNIRYVNELKEFRNDVEIENREVNDYLSRFNKSLLVCSSQVVAATNQNDPYNRIAVKHAHTCNHRLCTICNNLRAKKLRRKFNSFFSDENIDFNIQKKYKHFFSPLLLSIGNNTVSGAMIMQSMDFMHLTLTVPHNNGVWNGKTYYAKELLQRFNTMRKFEWWKNTVFAGEACVETTQSEKNGLHIHIHALLLVPKHIRRSRNFLYGKILENWNSLTIDQSIEKIDLKTQDTDRYIGISNSLQCIDDNKTYFKILNNIDNRGSTLVGIKNLYKEVTAETYARLKNGKFMQDGKCYKYVNSANTKEMVKGIMECLKYHFEPCSMEDDNGKLNVPLLCELLPNIYRQRLYVKFGAFFGVKKLNVSENVSLEDCNIDDFEDTAQNDSYCPITGESCDSKTLEWLVFDLKDVRLNGNRKTYWIPSEKIKRRIGTGYNTKSAIHEFMWQITSMEANFQRIKKPDFDVLDFSEN